MKSQQSFVMHVLCLASVIMILIPAAQSVPPPEPPCPFRKTRIVSCDQEITEYSWTPDGTRFLYSANEPGPLGKQKLYTISSSGGKPTQVLNEAVEVGTPFSWFPDGKRVVTGSNLGHFLIIDIQQGHVKEIDLDSLGGYWPIVSPDGEYIGFRSHPAHTDEFQLWLLPIGGGPLIQLTSKPIRPTSFCWSPDGDAILYESHTKDLHELWMMIVSNGQQRRLAAASLEIRHAIWAPDGDQIAYYREFPEPQFYIADLLGQKQRVIDVYPLPEASWPSWSPNGQWLAFSVGKHEGADFWICHVETGGMIRLTDGRGCIQWNLRWSPDGSRLAYLSGATTREIWTIDVSCL